MMLKRGIQTILVAFFVVLMATAQNPSEVITDYLHEKSEGRITVIQPNELRARIKAKAMLENADTLDFEAKNKTVGYRVQVFSDNNQRTAKNQAEVRQHKISIQFPEWSVYRFYKSPMWRVRVGDFKTRGEAEFAMHELKEAFPSYAREMMVVVDNINLPEK